MRYPRYAATMPVMEPNEVIVQRPFKMAGGQDARDEAHPIVGETFDAPVEAHGSLFGGGTPAVVAGRHRERVSANARRVTS